MSNSIDIEYEVVLVPVGETLATTSEARVESFVDRYDTRYTEQSVVERELAEREIIDPYAMREHWRAVSVSAVFSDPPWGGSLRQLIADVERLNYVHDVFTSRGAPTIVHMVVAAGREADVERQLSGYFSGFSPLVSTEMLTFCPDAPLSDLSVDF